MGGAARRPPERTRIAAVEARGRERRRQEQAGADGAGVEDVEGWVSGGSERVEEASDRAERVARRRYSEFRYQTAPPPLRADFPALQDGSLRIPTAVPSLTAPITGGALSVVILDFELDLFTPALFHRPAHAGRLAARAIRDKVKGTLPAELDGSVVTVMVFIFL